MREGDAFHVAACFGLSVGIASAQDRSARFTERDANGDGVLTSHEYQATGGHPGNFRALDANGDGQLTRGEFLGREGVQEQVYDYRVYKEDNRVYRDDNRVYKDDASRARRRGESVKVSPGVSGNADVLSKRTRDAFSVKDRNRDGRLTRAEYGDSRTFRRADSNRDRRISYQEFLDSRVR